MATNAPTGVDASAPFKQNQQMMRDTENYLRAMGQLKLKMGHAWDYEINDFQSAGPEDQAFYNLMPPASPKRTRDEVAAVASNWAERFRSDDGIKIGTDLAKVQDVISTCAENAKSGDFGDCKPGQDPTKLPEYLAGQGAIDDYLQHGRVVKMRAYVINKGAPQGYAGAKAACQNDNGYVDRLPSEDDARRLAPLVSGFGGGDSKSVWLGDTASCKFSASGMPYYTNPNDGRSDDTGCDGWSIWSGGSRPVICVPEMGPVGKRDDL
jgi:hypothetical protein